MSSKFLKAVFLQFSGTVGAGIFSLPFALYSSNFYLASLFFIATGVIVAFVNQIYLDVITSTPGDHQLSGYSQIYLGSRFRKLAVLNIILLTLGVLIAYINIAAKFIPIILPQVNPAIAPHIFVALLLLFFLLRSPLISFFHLIIPVIIIFIPFIFLSASFTLPPQLINYQPFSLIFIGPVLFSLSSFTIVPEVEEVLRHQTTKLRLASFLGTILSVCIYLIFVYSILRLTDGRVTPDTITGILQRSHLLGYILSILGFLAVFNASLNFMTVLKETFFRDLNLSSRVSFFAASSLPIILLLVPHLSFFQVISLTGGVTVFISVLLICLIRLRQKTTPVTRKMIYTILLFFSLCLLTTLFF